MSTPVASQSFNVTKVPVNVAVNSHWLLALYSVIPLSLLAVLLDYLFFDFRLRELLPSNPASLVIWAVIFNFPHITSSLITLLDDEYIPFYKQKFSRILLVIVFAVLTLNFLVPMLFPGLPSAIVMAAFFAFYASYTMYHVLSQQFGVGMILMKKPSGTAAYERWRWSGAIAASFMYGMVFAEPALKVVQLYGYTAYQIAGAFAALFIAFATVQGLALTQGSQRLLGTWYVYSNVAMLLATYALLLMGYGFFVIAIPRIVHDITALSIYSVHDQNRNSVKQHNYVYRALSFLRVPPLILCTLLAIAVANSIQCGAYLFDTWLGFKSVSECAIQHYYTPATAENPLPHSMQLWLQILFICGFFHYYIEGFVWKRDAIHRHAIKFS